MKTDLALLQRYHHHGDAGAFAELVRTHAGMVYATAQRVTRDAALAEDVAQEAFLKLARASHQTIDCVGAWLHHVTRQRACDAIRSKVTRQRYEPAAEHWHDTAREASWAEIEPLVDEVLDALPEELRSLLVEHFLEQRAQQEIARRMGVSQSTVSRKLETALQALREGLAKKGVLCGAGLAGLLITQSAHATPGTLVTSLNKIGMTGAGTSAVGSIATSSTLLTMTATTKILFAAGTAAVVSIPFLLSPSNTPSTANPATTSAASAPPPGSRGFATLTADSRPQSAAIQPPKDPEEEKRKWEELIVDMDDREVALAYFRKSGGTIKEDYVDQTLTDIVERNYGGSQAAFERALSEKGQTLDEFRRKQREDIIISVLKARATQGINIADPIERAVAREKGFKEWIQELRHNGGKWVPR
ncbi:RNA polymerase sigma factor (sigma-70 family) [Roseimicrobium gellanilyticum]|uniref:RNA polymerase sigma factor (Sigma-70 family) n=1 Tax=Roseimicrobium gellanilyticum TaxID=748857 RepID=A0A366HPJ3_9BACT|nr:sigma-70 family RNA polymerase sigma factor [Roseimicrobium gellanilyticum]RBP45430.1 RNA polymerase sigma factor (sigma-70 family) [Roseimicrobium gellanilyticum]